MLAFKKAESGDRPFAAIRASKSQKLYCIPFMRQKRTNTNAQRAKKYNCHPRTIAAWKRDGAPLDHPRAMRTWLAGRKNIPPNLTATSTGSVPSVATVTATPQTLGAPAALKRLESAEANAYTRLEAALVKGDALTVKQCRETWLKLCESLRHYERAVAEEKRQRGELVPRLEVQTALATLGNVMRISSEAGVHQLTQEVQAEPNFIRAVHFIRRSNYCHTVHGHAFLRALSVPTWISDALSTDLVSVSPTNAATLDALAEEIKQRGLEAVQTVIATEEPAPAR